jgi:RNase H-fold protein (predicted Holliday junction resolvase)
LLEEQSGRVLHDAKQVKRGQKPVRASVDAVAAAVILKEYLDLQRGIKGDSEHI